MQEQKGEERKEMEQKGKEEEQLEVNGLEAGREKEKSENERERKRERWEDNNEGYDKFSSCCLSLKGVRV